MWNVECARCGEQISAESPDEIKTDENGDPRHEECPYAEEPDYPLTFSVRTSLRPSLDRVVKREFTHLTPQIEDDSHRIEYPNQLQELGNLSARYRVKMPDEGDSIWDVTVELVKVNGEQVAPQLPRLIYECEECGTQVEGKVHYLTEGHRPFMHKECGRNGAQFRPVEFSHLDRTTSESSEEEVLEEYQQKYE